jgi:hypothetical protein
MCPRCRRTSSMRRQTRWCRSWQGLPPRFRFPTPPLAVYSDGRRIGRRGKARTCFRDMTSVLSLVTRQYGVVKPQCAALLLQGPGGVVLRFTFTRVQVQDQVRILLVSPSRVQRAAGALWVARRRVLGGGERAWLLVRGPRASNGAVAAVRQRNDCTACRCRHKWASRARRGRGSKGCT